MQTRFTFRCGGEELIVTLHRPSTGETAVAVVTGPLTSVKEQASGAWAKALAQRGIGCLAFDHRYFGESGGKPRQLENPYAKIEDIRAAVDALRGKPEFTAKPIVAVGICAGAGYWPAPLRKNRGSLPSPPSPDITPRHPSPRAPRLGAAWSGHRPQSDAGRRPELQR